MLPEVLPGILADFLLQPMHKGFGKVSNTGIFTCVSRKIGKRLLVDTLTADTVTALLTTTYPCRYQWSIAAYGEGERPFECGRRLSEEVC